MDKKLIPQIKRAHSDKFWIMKALTYGLCLEAKLRQFFSSEMLSSIFFAWKGKQKSNQTNLQHHFWSPGFWAGVASSLPSSFRHFCPKTAKWQQLVQPFMSSQCDLEGSPMVFYRLFYHCCLAGWTTGRRCRAVCSHYRC